mgnify:CR=1 FL=1|jgi:predicted transcriptional regulator
MMNADEAKRATDKTNAMSEIQKAKKAAQQICETVINKKIEDAVQNGCNIIFYANGKLYDKDFHKMIEQYLKDKGYKVWKQSTRVIAIQW